LNDNNNTNTNNNNSNNTNNTAADDNSSSNNKSSRQIESVDQGHNFVLSEFFYNLKNNYSLPKEEIQLFLFNDMFGVAKFLPENAKKKYSFLEMIKFSRIEKIYCYMYQLDPPALPSTPKSNNNNRANADQKGGGVQILKLTV